MSLKKLKNGKIIAYTIVLIEIILIINGILALIKPLNKYEYMGRDLIAPKAIFIEKFMGEERDGYYIDDSLIKEGDNIEEYSIEIPVTDLNKGSYEVSICYKTGTNVNRYTVTSISNYYYTKIGRQEIGLVPEEDICTFSLESNLDIEGYNITINFAGENYIFVDKISIVETHFWRIKNLLKIIVGIGIFNCCWCGYTKKAKFFNKRNLTIGLLLGSCVLLASQPVFAPYLYSGHDLEFHLNRIEGIKNALLAGQFPVRMHHSSIGGAGYPVSIFYGDIFLYIPAVMRILGWSVQSAYQGYIVMVNAISCLIMYKVLVSIFDDDWLAMFGTFIYVMAPYRLMCIYLRAAVGEYTAMCFYPLIIYGLYKIYTEQKQRNNWIYFALGFSGLIFSHIISAFSAFVLTLLFCIVNIKSTVKKDILLKFVKAVMFTIGLGVWFIVPFIDYMRSGIIENEVSIKGFFEGRTLTLSQLLTMFPAGIGEAFPIHEEIRSNLEMSYAIGITFVLGLIIYVFCYINMENKKSKIEILGKKTFGFSLIALLMTTCYFPWNELERLGSGSLFVMQNIQYPWRFLGVASVLLVFTSVIGVWRVKNQGLNNIYINIVSVMCILSLVSGNYFMTEYMNTNEKLYITDERDVPSNAVGAGEYLPKDAVVSYEDIWYSKEQVEIGGSRRENSVYYIECINVTCEKQYIELPIIFYKNYHVRDVDSGCEMIIESGAQSRIRVEIPENYSGEILVEYCSPWYWRLSELISLITLGASIFVGLYSKKKVVSG